MPNKAIQRDIAKERMKTCSRDLVRGLDELIRAHGAVVALTAYYETVREGRMTEYGKALARTLADRANQRFAEVGLGCCTSLHMLLCARQHYDEARGKKRDDRMPFGFSREWDKYGELAAIVESIVTLPPSVQG